MRYLGNITRLSLVVLSSLAVPAWGATLCVTVGGQFGCYAHISAAVTAANAGDVILVGPGTYHESVVITKPLTLGSFGATINATGLKHALQNQGASAAQTYVGLVDGELVGYSTLSVGQVEYTDAPERLQKGLARHPVPIMLLARLAVHKDWQGKGIGKAVLKDSMLRTMQAAEIAGIRALAVHAKDDQARRYYEQFDFIASPTDPLHLFVSLKDLRRIAGA